MEQAEAKEVTATGEKGDEEGTKKHKRQSRAGRAGSGGPETGGAEEVTTTAHRDSRRAADDSKKSKRSKHRHKRTRDGAPSAERAERKQSTNAGASHSASQPATQSATAVASPISQGSRQAPTSAPPPQIVSPNPALVLTPGDESPSRKARPSASTLLSPFREGMFSSEVRQALDQEWALTQTHLSPGDTITVLLQLHPIAMTGGVYKTHAWSDSVSQRIGHSGDHPFTSGSG
ncbi:uncharacterized protein LOC144094627 [Amblyomma americanum]